MSTFPYEANGPFLDARIREMRRRLTQRARHSFLSDLGVNVGEGAVLGLGSVATRNLDPWAVYAGVPAVKVKDRLRLAVGRAAID